jgi:hypothetical protein
MEVLLKDGGGSKDVFMASQDDSIISKGAYFDTLRLWKI